MSESTPLPAMHTGGVPLVLPPGTVVTDFLVGEVSMWLDLMATKGSGQRLDAAQRAFLNRMMDRIDAFKRQLPPQPGPCWMVIVEPWLWDTSILLMTWQLPPGMDPCTH